jgi:hypothetical protein
MITVQFPISCEIEGVPVVTIPAAEYAELLRCRQSAAAFAVRQTRLIAASSSPIDRDQELAAFLAEGLQTMIIRELHAACLAKFGAARTPSRSAIHRFWNRLRGLPSRPI